MRLYHLVIEPGGPSGPRSGPAGNPMVLVVAASAQEARAAITAALNVEAAVASALRLDQLPILELCPHTGPEAPGSVFLNGFLIAA